MLGLAIFLPTIADAADVTLQWAPSGSGSVTGYVLLYGSSSGSYSQQFDVGNSTSYTVTNLASGYTYYFVVRAYDATGATSALSSEVIATMPSTIQSIVTSLSVTSSVPSPQRAGTTINWAATSAGGIAPYQYQWSLYNAGSWALGAWTTASTWSWTPPRASDYQIRVAVRSAGSSNATGEMVQTVPFAISVPSASSATLSANLSSPQTALTTIIWSVRGAGGVTPYQYKWWISDGRTWTAKTNWTKSATWSWTPTVENSNYSVGVWIRSAGDLTDAAEVSAVVPFVITATQSQVKKK